MSWSVKSTVPDPRISERQIQFVPSIFAGFADLMGFHRHLLDDEVRTKALIRAIDVVVKPGHVVVDLGTGTGILAMAAARAGAARVFALEHNSIVNSARALARENGLDQIIEFVKMDSHDFCLAEKADVIISECFGLLGLGGTMAAALSDMILRNLKPGGSVIPVSLSIHIAPVESDFHYNYVHCWQQSRYGFSFEQLNTLAVNNLYLAAFKESDFLADPSQIANVSFARDLPEGRLNVHVKFRSSRPARLHGYCGWFTAQLAEGVTLDTGPMSPPQIWRQLYLPLEHEVLLQPGVTVDLNLSIFQGFDPAVPVSFYWKTRVDDASGSQTCFVQSTLKSFPAGIQPGTQPGTQI